MSLGVGDLEKHQLDGVHLYVYCKMCRETVEGEKGSSCMFLATYPSPKLGSPTDPLLSQLHSNQIEFGTRAGLCLLAAVAMETRGEPEGEAEC